MKKGFSIVDQGKGPQSPAPSPGPHPRSGERISYLGKISLRAVHITGAGHSRTGSIFRFLIRQVGSYLHRPVVLGRSTIGTAANVLTTVPSPKLIVRAICRMLNPWRRSSITCPY